MNVAYLENGKPVAAYVDFDGLMDTIVELLTEVRDEYGQDSSDKDLIALEFGDDYIAEVAFSMAASFNRDMKEYLHMESHRIYGNFNNAERDYPRENSGQTFDAMLARLDAMEDSEQANADRQWLTAWFWQTFGTFGIKYNFGEEISGRLYEYAEELANAE